MADLDELQAKLKNLSDDYAAQLPEKLKQLEQVWEQLPMNGWDEEGFQTLHRMVHNLTGSGKTFGFDLLSDVARHLEEHLKQFMLAKPILSGQQRSYTHGLIRELHQVTLRRDAWVNNPTALVAVTAFNQSTVSLKHIFVVDADHESADKLKVQLCYFGYEVSVFGNLADFQLAMQANPNVVILISINFPEDSWGGINAIKEIQQGRGIGLPVIFLTAHDEFDTRLEAVRAGSLAYLSKPVSIGSLVDKLDHLTSILPPAPYRVLIVDDSKSLATYYALMLEQVGMVVKVINNPLDVMVALFEFTPDLILLDIFMPECNGLELAKVIRQIDAFVSIPIVYLSVESNLDTQLFAMGLGGDDFLSKPIQPQHLISSITSRIQRSLILRSFMVRDNLTGLLNHTAIQDCLALEVACAKRQKTQLAFAMIDIDYFKQVNDTYGHPVGDGVIKSLSRMLKQRLRETDMIGRYGGEEFAVILSNAGRMEAVEVLDTIRKDFSQFRHLADGKEFFVTFSCGIADISQFSDTAKLVNAADKALHKAKNAGRNQAVLAEGAAVGVAGLSL